jgi:hypothetical protein
MKDNRVIVIDGTNIQHIAIFSYIYQYNFKLFKFLADILKTKGLEMIGRAHV